MVVKFFSVLPVRCIAAEDAVFERFAALRKAGNGIRFAVFPGAIDDKKHNL